MNFLKITITMLLLAVSSSVMMAHSVARDALEAVSRECAAAKIFAPSELSPVDSLLVHDHGSISTEKALKAVFDQMVRLSSAGRCNDVVLMGMACADRFAECEEMSREEIRLYIHLLDQYGFCCQSVGLVSELSGTYLRALDMARREGFDEEQAILMSNIGSLYYRLKDMDKASAMFTDAIKINERLKKSENLFVNYNNMSAVCAGQNNIDKALEYAFMALHQVDKAADTDKYMLMERNIASIYSRKGMKAHAIGMLQEIAAYQEQMKQTPYLIDTYQILGCIYMDINRLDSAHYYLKKGLETSGGSSIGLLKSYADVNQRLGNYHEANASLERYIHLRDSIYQRDSKNRIDGLLSLYTDQQRQSRAIAELYEQKSHLVTAIIVGVVILLISIAAAAIATRAAILRRRRKLISKVSQLLRDKTDVVHEMELKIQKIESNHRIEHNQALMQSVESMRDHEFAMQTAESLKALLLKLNPKSVEAKNDIRAILSSLNQYESHSGIDEFNATFEKLHPLFYGNLISNFGNLTPKELRLCALIRLGLSSKSIADITFREPRSVESARNRLRKKFNLQQQEDLAAFLMRY